MGLTSKKPGLFEDPALREINSLLNKVDNYTIGQTWMDKAVKNAIHS